MYYGELKEHSKEYQNGHFTGSVRAYDDAIGWFEEIAANEKSGSKHSIGEVIAMLKYCKDNWIRHCEDFGMGEM